MPSPSKSPRTRAGSGDLPGKLCIVGTNWARIWRDQLQQNRIGRPKMFLTRQFNRSHAHDHGRCMTSLVIIVPECSNISATLESALARSFAVERVTKIELA